MKEQKLRQIIREEIQQMTEAAERREVRNLRTWLQDLKDLAPDFDSDVAKRIADHVGVRLDDDVYIEPLEPQTVNQLINNPDVDLVDIGGNMVVLFFGPDNPGVDLSEVVALGKNNGRPFWMVYSKQNAQ